MKLLKNKSRRRLGIPGRPAIVLRPDESVPISDNQIEEIQRNRTVARWLNSEVLELIDQSDSEKEPSRKVVKSTRPEKPRYRRNKSNDVRETLVLPDGVTGEGVEVHHKGGGWYEVYANGFLVTDKNVRKDEAQNIAKEYE
jgi:hypothetical protein